MLCLKVVLLILVATFSNVVYGQDITNFKATAYCLSGITAKGHGVRRGIIAVDPKVIPLNSVVFISYPSTVKGYYIASDTGRLIKNNLIDIWVPTCTEARDWGRRNIKFKILPAETTLVHNIVKRRGANLNTLQLPLGTITRIVPR